MDTLNLFKNFENKNEIGNKKRRRLERIEKKLDALFLLKDDPSNIEKIVKEIEKMEKEKDDGKKLEEIENFINKNLEEEFDFYKFEKQKIEFPEFIIQGFGKENFPIGTTKEEIRECIIRLFRDEIKKEGEDYSKEIEIKGDNISKKFKIYLRPNDINLQMKALLNVKTCYTPLSGFPQAFIAIQYLAHPQIFFGVVTNSKDAPIARVSVVNANKVVKLNKIYFNYNDDKKFKLKVYQEIPNALKEALKEFSELNEKEFPQTSEVVITLKGANKDFPYLKTIDGEVLNFSLDEKENKITFFLDPAFLNLKDFKIINDLI
ncbi:MAG: hypothetical protein ACPLXS_01560 [Candidatus Micrarchaeales archaeon]